MGTGNYRNIILVDRAQGKGSGGYKFLVCQSRSSYNSWRENSNCSYSLTISFHVSIIVNKNQPTRDNIVPVKQPCALYTALNTKVYPTINSEARVCPAVRFYLGAHIYCISHFYIRKINIRKYFTVIYYSQFIYSGLNLYYHNMLVKTFTECNVFFVKGKIHCMDFNECRL